jgi:hypothetical protein
MVDKVAVKQVLWALPSSPPIRSRYNRSIWGRINKGPNLTRILQLTSQYLSKMRLWGYLWTLSRTTETVDTQVSAEHFMWSYQRLSDRPQYVTTVTQEAARRRTE